MRILQIISKWILSIAQSILFIVLFVAIFLAVDSFVMNRRLKDFKKVSVTRETMPELFPVLIITQGPGADEYHAKTVLYKNLNAYLMEHQNYTFLVPAGGDEQLNAELKQNSRGSRKPQNFDWASPDPWWAYFKAKRLAEERQYLEVYHTWDDDRDNTGWYEATAKEIFPKYHQLYFGPGVGLSVLHISFFSTCALWIACFIAYKLFRKYRNARNLRI